MADVASCCPLCRQFTFTQRNDLILNLVNFLRSPLTCPICQFTASCSSVLGDHLMQHYDIGSSTPSASIATAVRKYVCKQCKTFETDDLSALNVHVQSEHPERKFMCPHCCKLFKVQASLTLHLKMAHSGETSGSLYQCQICRKRFATLRRKEIHEKRHLPPPAVPDMATKNNKLVSSSLVINSNNKQPEMAPTDENKIFTCPFCEKSFKKDQYLQQHVRTHEAKKWECQVCHKLFTTKEYLRKHARLHTGETPYTCDLCSKTFTFQQSYHKHLLYHSDERPYSCDQCGRRFKELSTLHNHQRIHTGEKPYTCDTCGKSFRQRVSYVVHRRIHTGALPYICTACGKSFRYKVSQRTHKCEANSNVDDDTDLNNHRSIVRNRPSWLERLVTAQQQNIFGNSVPTQVDPEMMPIAMNSDIVDAESSMITDAPTVHQPSTSDVAAQNIRLIDPKTYYDSDYLPSLDLSQLTLNLDSDLIFPSQ